MSEQRWTSDIGKNLIKSATFEYYETWFFCDKCETKVHFNSTHDKDNWTCQNILKRDEYGDEIKCTGNKLIETVIPQLDTFTNEYLNFWEAFRIKKK